MNELDATVVTQVTHGHFDTLLKLGFKPEYIEDSDARAIWMAAADMVHRTPAIKPNKLNLLSATTGELKDYDEVKKLLWLNGSGESAPELVVGKSYDRHLQKSSRDVMDKFQRLAVTKPNEIKQWLPVLAQELELIATTGYAYNPNPEAHIGSIVAPIMFPSYLSIYNDMFAGEAGDGGGYRKGWWVVWLGMTGGGKTTNSYTQAIDAIRQGKRQVFVSKENQSQIRARVLLGLTGLTRQEIESGVAVEQDAVREADGSFFSVEGLGEFYKKDVRQTIMKEWTEQIQDKHLLRLYDWTFAKSSYIKSIISTENPDIVTIDYIDQNDVPGNDKIGGLGKISSELERIAHNSGKHINGYFQISADERKKYEKNDFHSIVGPFGSSMVTHPADQVFQTKKWKEPFTQHTRRTKCRAGGLDKNWVAGFDRIRWVFHDIPQLPRFNQIG